MKISAQLSQHATEASRSQPVIAYRFTTTTRNVWSVGDEQDNVEVFQVV